MSTLEELTSIASRLPESARLALLAKARELEGSARADALERLRQARERLARADAGLETLPPGLATFDRHAGAFSGKIDREECYGR